MTARKLMVATLAGVFAAGVAVAIVFFGCTIDVGQPNIQIGCVEVDFPTEHVLYCDGGLVKMPGPPPAKDAGHG